MGLHFSPWPLVRGEAAVGLATAEACLQGAGACQSPAAGVPSAFALLPDLCPAKLNPLPRADLREGSEGKCLLSLRIFVWFSSYA